MTSYKSGSGRWTQNPLYRWKARPLLVSRVYAQKPCNYKRSAETLTGGRANVIHVAGARMFSDIHTYVVDEEHAGDVFQDPELIMSLISFWRECLGTSEVQMFPPVLQR